MWCFFLEITKKRTKIEESNVFFSKSYPMLNYKEIILVICLALQSFSGIVAQNIKKGFRLLRKDSITQAEHLFQEMLTQNPYHPLAHYGLSLVYASAHLPQCKLELAHYHLQKVQENYNQQVEKLVSLQAIQQNKQSIEATLHNDAFWLACQENNITSMNAFLEKYPQSPHQPIIYSKIDSLAFEYARKQHSIDSYNDFLNKHPNATQRTIAMELRNELAFEEAKKTHTQEAYNNFIGQYPDALQINEAQKLKKELEIYNKNYLTGRFSPQSHELFVMIDEEYLLYNKNIYLRKEAYDAFVEMQAAAAKEGISLKIISATRTFYEQQTIWDNRWHHFNHLPPPDRIKRIMNYNSMPGISRHHWGTDIDLNGLSDAYFQTAEGKKIYDWLCENAYQYGFFQPYTPIDPSRPTGYEEEKWHWSYLPIAQKCLQEYLSQVSYKDIGGFYGADLADELRIIEHYVKGINPQLLYFD